MFAVVLRKILYVLSLDIFSKVIISAEIEQEQENVRSHNYLCLRSIR